MPPGEYEQFINKNGLQTFVLRVNMETDPNRKEDMKLAIVDYYREKVNPNDQASSDTQILTNLGVKLPQRSDTAPTGTVIGNEIIDSSKSVAWNRYNSLKSTRESQVKMLADYYITKEKIENNSVQLQKDGVYNERIKQINEQIEACRNLIEETDREIAKVKPQYVKELPEKERKEEEKKMKEEEEKRRETEEAIALFRKKYGNKGGIALDLPKVPSGHDNKGAIAPDRPEVSSGHDNKGDIAPDRPEDPVGHSGAGHNTYDNGGSLRPGKKPRNLNETRAIVDIPLMGPIEGIG